MATPSDQRPASNPVEGRTYLPETPHDLAEAIELAFDYRGDVTLLLASNERVEGYLFNRDLASAMPTVHLYPRNEPGTREIAVHEIVGISFTGEDTAFGKSWETWMAKKESQRRVEAEQIAEAARARGHL